MKYYKPWLKKRLSVGKTATPTYAIIDSQSVKTTSKSEQKGFDGGKKIKGRKRHILVDTIGNLLGVVVHAANIHDTKAGIMVVDKSLQIYPTIKAISADAGYRKTFSMIRNKKQNVKWIFKKTYFTNNVRSRRFNVRFMQFITIRTSFE